MECTNEWMEALGCKTVADLQKVEVERLVLTASTYLGLRIWPERDGRTVPLNPYDAWAEGAARDMEILHGCNKDEVGVFIWGMGREYFLAYAEDRKARKMELLTEEERALVESYCRDARDVGHDYSSSCRLIDQIVFAAPLFRLSEIQTKAGGAAYTYFFTPESSVPLVRCGHGVELNTVFNHPEELRIAGRPFDETFSRTMRRMWVQFAKCGDPSLTAGQSPDGHAKEWPRYDPEDRYVMVLDESGIHPEREADRSILDWERTYFLTKHYFI